MQKGNISHKESLPSQRHVKRRKLDVVDRVEAVANASEVRHPKQKENQKKQRELPVETDETASHSSSDSDSDDIEAERQRLQQLRESRVRQNSTNEDPTTERSSDYDVLFRKRFTRSSKGINVQNNKQESTAYKNFMKKMFK